MVVGVVATFPVIGCFSFQQEDKERGMEIGVLLVSLALVFLTSFLLSVLGAGTFFSLLSLSVVLGGAFFYTGETNPAFRKRIVGR
jgi:hypothetical protein